MCVGLGPRAPSYQAGRRRVSETRLRNECPSQRLLCVAENCGDGQAMPDADFYRKQAELLLSWAAAAEDPIVKEQLRGRAQDYMSLAATLEQRARPTAAEPAAAQQQQQIQPKTKPSAVKD